MTEHTFEPGGDDSTYGPRGSWCQHGEGSEEGPCGKPAVDHPPVTAEPATAPSVEQIAAAGAPKSGAVEMAKWAATRIKELGVPEVLAGTGVAANTWQSAARRLIAKNEDLRAENERLRAALEAAHEHIVAWDFVTDEVCDTKVTFSVAYEIAETRGKYYAARAAVEADTEGGSR